MWFIKSQKVAWRMVLAFSCWSQTYHTIQTTVPISETKTASQSATSMQRHAKWSPSICLSMCEQEYTLTFACCSTQRKKEKQYDAYLRPTWLMPAKAGTESKQSVITAMMLFIDPAHDELGTYNQPFTSKSLTSALVSDLPTIAALVFFTCEAVVAAHACSCSECQCSWLQRSQIKQ